MAQDISGTNLETNAAATDRVVSVQFNVAWGRAAWVTDWSTQSTDETARLLDFSLERQLSLDPLQLGVSRPATLSVTLDNRDQRFSAFNTASALTGSILGSSTTAGGDTVAYPKLAGSPVRLRVGYYDTTNGHERVTVFTGRIDDLQQDAYGLDGGRLTFQALDRGAELVDTRTSTAMRANVRADQWIASLLDSVSMPHSLDTGIFVLPYVWMDDETIWQECHDAAAADGGYFYIDETGVARYRAAHWWATAEDSTSSQATITTGTLQNIAANADWSNLATGLVIEYTPRSPGGEQDLYRSESALVVPPGVKAVDMRFSYPRDVGKLPIPAFTAVTSGGRRLQNVNVNYAAGMAAQRGQLVFDNSNSETAFIAPFTLRGHAIMGAQTKTREATVSGLALTSNIKRAPSNPYVQTEAQADMLAALLGDRLRYPRMTYTVSGFKALPWLQLGDRVTITLPEAITVSRSMIVTAISLSWRPDAPLLQTLTGIDRAGLFEYEDYFILGASAYGTGSEAGRVWL